MRVLYVDDDPTMTAAVERMFTSEDIRCDTSALGEAAVDLAKQNGYDIILLDVMLPDIDGYEVIKRLRTAGVRTPVLLQSGLVDRESDVNGLWLGASDYLLKPFNKRELFERIQAVLSRPVDSWPHDPILVQQPSSFPADATDRRRRHRRFETVQPGRILHDGGIDCLILNMSHGGAALQLFDPQADCPESFDLLLQSGATLRCHVRWRSAEKIGVQGAALFPDEVVTDMLKQGEAADPEAALADASAGEPEPVPQAAEPAADERPDTSPAQPPREAAEPAAESPAEDRGQPHAPVRAGNGEDGDGRVFRVDRGTHLVAEACDHEELLVEGHLETAARARRLHLGREGRFAGSAEVESAEIGGHYEGDLTVAGRLVIHAGGTVSGTIRYREIAIESGGALVGKVQLLLSGPEGAVARSEAAPGAAPLAQPVAPDRG